MSFSEILLEALKGAVTGAVIGWVTNWLAVWMLFHPRSQWKLFGIALPLTPGLVVKNHARLAEAIGNAVSRDLLAPETLLAHLERSNLSRAIENLLHAERTTLLETNVSIAEKLGALHAESLKEFERRVGSAATTLAAETLTRIAQNSQQQREFISQFLQPILDQPVGAFISAQQATQLRAWALPTVDGWLASDAAGTFAADALGAAMDRFPQTDAFGKTQQYLRNLVSDKQQGTAIFLQEALARYAAGESFAESAQPVLARRIHAMILSRFSFAALLVTEKKVREVVAENWEQFSGELQTLLRGEDLTNYFAAGIAGYAAPMIDSLATRLQGEDAQHFVSTASRQLLAELRVYLLSQTTAAALEGKIAALLQKTPAEILAALNADPHTLSQQVFGKLSAWASSENGTRILEEKIAGAVHYFLHDVSAARIARIIPDAEWTNVSRVIAQAIEVRTLRIMPTILADHLNLAEIVRNKILEFETNRLEQIIYEVSGRELRGIVWFGAVLGVVVGAVGGVVGLVFR